MREKKRKKVEATEEMEEERGKNEDAAHGSLFARVARICPGEILIWQRATILPRILQRGPRSFL